MRMITTVRTVSMLVLGVMAMGLVGRAAGFAPWQAPAPVPMFGYTIVHTYPHDRDAFTQGLQVVDGTFYEGTGLNGRSSIRKVKW